MKKLLSAVVFVFAVACSDSFLRTNPYDPAFPVQISIGRIASSQRR